MNKNTMLYGLLIAGGLLAYFAWKKNNAGSSDSLTESTSTSRTFVDDVPVSQGVADELLQGTAVVKPIRTTKDTISQIIEPLIGTKQQMELSGKGQFLES
jgi:hypothetical protein